MNLRNHLLPALILAVWCALSGPVRAEDAISLQPRFDAGKKYLSEISSQVEMAIAEMTQNVDMNQTLSVVAAARQDGKEGKSLTVSLEAVKMEIKSPAMQMEYDSTAPESAGNLLASTFAGVLGKPFTLLVDAAGNVEELADENAGTPAGAPGVPSVGPEDIRQMTMAMLRGLPGEPKKPGDSWDHSATLPAGQLGEIDVETKYHYARNENRDGHQVAVIEFTGKVSGQPGDASAPAEPLKLEVKDANIKGVMYFDPAIGQTRAMNQTMTMTAAMQGPNGQEMIIPTTQKSVMKLVSVTDTE